MGAFYEENTVSRLSTTTVAHDVATVTTLFTVPSNFRLIMDKVDIEAAGDEAATDITIGQVGALTDFIGTTQLDNLDAQYDAVTVKPIQADPPVQKKSYATGTVIQVDVTAANGNAGNIYLLFGTLKAV